MIIGLTGRAGAGKDTVGAILSKLYGFDRLSFASPIKAMMATIGIHEPDRSLKELPLEGYPFSYRTATQVLGTEFGRAIDPDLWVKLGMKKAQLLSDSGFCVVFTDCRFDNEAEAIHKAGGKIWNVGGRAYDMGAASSHASEKGLTLANIDEFLLNDSTLDVLKVRVKALMKGQK